MRGKARGNDSTVVVRARCSAEERDAWAKAAAKHKVELSEAIRRLLEMLRRGEVRL